MSIMLRTTGKYFVVKEIKEEQKSESGLYLGSMGPQYTKGVVVDCPDSFKLIGATVAINQHIKEVEGHIIVHPDQVLCVLEES